MPNTTSISVTILITKGLGPIVSHYKKNIATSNFGRLIDEVKSVYGDYLKSGSLDDLRFLLALCIRAHHGHRMPWNTTRLAVDTLIRNNIINRLGSFATFEDLYNEIKKYLLVSNLHKDHFPFMIQQFCLGNWLVHPWSLQI